MSGIERITSALLDLLELLLGAHMNGEQLHGWAMISATKRAGPTIYRTLDRLEDAKWVTAHWETENPDPSKPRRRFYHLTPTGVEEAQAILAERRPAALEKLDRAAERRGFHGFPGPALGGAR